MEEHPQIRTPVIAGFWRRLTAFLIDTTILGAIGMALGMLLAEQFVAIGSWGRLVGFCIAWTYFGILNSRLGGGQTLGKRILGIKVINRGGYTLSVRRAFIRFLPLGAVWFLNGAAWPASLTEPWTVYVLSVAVFGVGACIVGLFLINRTSRQSIHDIAVASFVVRSPEPTHVPGQIQSSRRLNMTVCGFLLLCSLGLAYYGQQFSNKQALAHLKSLHDALTSTTWVRRAEVFDGESIVTSESGTNSRKSYLSIDAYIADADHDSARLEYLARLAFSVYPDAKNFDAIHVSLRYGYDIGIASSWKTKRASYSPAEWLDQ